MPKKFESDQEAVFSMAFLTKVITTITIMVTMINIVVTIITTVDIILTTITIVVIMVGGSLDHRL